MEAFWALHTGEHRRILLKTSSADAAYLIYILLFPHELAHATASSFSGNALSGNGGRTFLGKKYFDPVDSL
jgi:hypothetical protein